MGCDIWGKGGVSANSKKRNLSTLLGERLVLVAGDELHDGHDAAEAIGELLEEQRLGGGEDPLERVEARAE